MEKKEKFGLKSLKGKFNQLSGKKIGSAAKWLAQFAFFPLSKYQAPIFLSFILGVAPTTSLLFPKAEEYLEDNNIDTEIMEELGVKGKAINVREIGSFAYNIHKFTEFPNIPLFMLGIYKDINFYGYANPQGISITDLKLRFNCQISIQKKEDSSFQDDMDNFGVDQRKSTILHELRHCSDENKKLPTIEREIDASYMAIHAAVQMAKDKKYTQKKLLYHNAFTRIDDDGYNAALYIDAKINGKPTPNIDAIRSANRKFAEMAKAGCIVLDKNQDALTARRGELFLEAIKFFAKESPSGASLGVARILANANTTVIKEDSEAQKRATEITLKFVNKQKFCR